MNENYSWIQDRDLNSDSNYSTSSKYAHFNSKEEKREISDITKKAIVLISMQLDSPEVLSQIPKYLINYANQAEVLKNQVTNNYTSQIEDARIASDIIDKSVEEKKLIHEKFNDIISLGNDTKELMKSIFPTICQINHTLGNVITTRNWLQRLLRFRSEVAALKDVIKREAKILLELHNVNVKLEKIEDESYGMHYGLNEKNYDDLDLDDDLLDDDEVETLVDVQDRLHQLIRFKIDALEEFQKNPIELKKFERDFSSIDKLDISFSSVVQGYMDIILEIVENYPDTVVMILRIVYREESYEDKIRREYSTEKQKQYPWRNLKNSLFKSLEKWIKAHFKNFLKGKKTMEEKLSTLLELPEDIYSYEEYVNQCFPPEYKILNFFSTTYQNEINSRITKWMKNKDSLPISDKLELCKWFKEYPSSCEKYFINYTTFQDYEKEYRILMDTTAHECHQLCHGWLRNIIDQMFKNHTKIVIEEPVLEPVYTHVPLDFFTSLQGILKPVEQVPELISSILDTIKKLQINFAEGYAATIEEHKKDIQFPVLMAMANDFKKCNVFIDRFASMINDTMTSLIDIEYSFEWTKDVKSQFDKRGEDCVVLLHEQIWDTIKEDFTSVFQTKWYTESTIGVICDTILDYKSNDFESGLEESYKKKLMRLLEDSFLKAYLDQFFSKSSQLQKNATSRIKDDLRDIQKVFGIYSKVFIAVNAIYSILSAEETNNFSLLKQDMYLLLDQFPDFQFHIADIIISKCRFQTQFQKTIRDFFSELLSTHINHKNVKTIFSNYKKEKKEKKTKNLTENASNLAQGNEKQLTVDTKGKKGVIKKKIFPSKGKKVGVTPLPGLQNTYNFQSSSPSPSEEDDLPDVEQIDLGDILSKEDLSQLTVNFDDRDDSSSDSSSY